MSLTVTSAPLSGFNRCIAPLPFSWAQSRYPPQAFSAQGDGGPCTLVAGRTVVPPLKHKPESTTLLLHVIDAVSAEMPCADKGFVYSHLALCANARSYLGRHLMGESTVTTNALLRVLKIVFATFATLTFSQRVTSECSWTNSTICPPNSPPQKCILQYDYYEARNHYTNTS